MITSRNTSGRRAFFSLPPPSRLVSFRLPQLPIRQPHFIFRSPCYVCYCPADRARCIVLTLLVTGVCQLPIDRRIFVQPKRNCYLYILIFYYSILGTFRNVCVQTLNKHNLFFNLYLSLISLIKKRKYDWSYFNFLKFFRTSFFK
jgi:hypothetical protein